MPGREAVGGTKKGKASSGTDEAYDRKAKKSETAALVNKSSQGVGKSKEGQKERKQSDREGFPTPWPRSLSFFEWSERATNVCQLDPVLSKTFISWEKKLEKANEDATKALREIGFAREQAKTARQMKMIRFAESYVKSYLESPQDEIKLLFVPQAWVGSSALLKGRYCRVEKVKTAALEMKQHDVT